MVGSFYNAERDEACAFEELISFHGGNGGATDARVHPPSAGARAPAEPGRRRGARARGPGRLASAAQRRLAGEALVRGDYAPFETRVGLVFATLGVLLWLATIAVVVAHPGWRDPAGGSPVYVCL
jgi:hypothetical protein